MYKMPSPKDIMRQLTVTHEEESLIDYALYKLGIQTSQRLSAMSLFKDDSTYYQQLLDEVGELREKLRETVGQEAR